MKWKQIYLRHRSALNKLCGELEGLQSCSCAYDCRIVFLFNKTRLQKLKRSCCLILERMMKCIDTRSLILDFFPKRILMTDPIVYDRPKVIVGVGEASALAESLTSGESLLYTGRIAKSLGTRITTSSGVFSSSNWRLSWIFLGFARVNRITRLSRVVPVIGLIPDRRTGV